MKNFRSAILLLGGLAGCLGQSITEVPEKPLSQSGLAYITASPAASIVAVSGTQQLSAVGASFAGDAVSTFDSVVYQYNTPSDSTKVSLSRTGLVTGRLSTGGSPVLINVIAFKDVSIRGDQVVVQVTPTANSGLVLSIQPTPPDS